MEKFKEGIIPPEKTANKELKHILLKSFNLLVWGQVARSCICRQNLTMHKWVKN